jgi:hypothetical protein
VRSRLKVLQRQGPDARALLRWYPWRQLVEPLAFLDLTTVWEQAWLTRWAATERQGTGAIVELGTWLGASSVALARRLDGEATIDAYDSFRFDDIEARTAATPYASRWRNGDSFRLLYEARLGRHAIRVRVHEGDVADERWEGGPIELLFVDLAKTWDLWDHLCRSWVPHVPVGGLILQQDWAHANTPWLHLWHHRWRRHLEPLDPVPASTMAVFRLVEPLPADAFEPVRLADFSSDEVAASFAWAATIVEPRWGANIAGAEVMAHVLHGRLDDAVAVAMRVLGEVPVVEELAGTALPELARRLAAAGQDPTALDR